MSFRKFTDVSRNRLLARAAPFQSHDREGVVSTEYATGSGGRRDSALFSWIWVPGWGWPGPAAGRTRRERPRPFWILRKL